MALIDHFAPDAGTEPGQNGFFKLPAHEFNASLQLLAAPAPVSVGKAAVIALWSLTEIPTPDADEEQLDELIANRAALADQALENEYVWTISSCLFLYQTNRLSKSQTETFLGITPGP